MTTAPSTEWTYAGHRGLLSARAWSDGRPAYVVVIAHGYGEHVGRYERLAAALVADGAAVYAVDHVGHGRSDGERVLVEDFEGVVGDLHELDRTARAANPGLPVALIGHSMGGLIGARYAQLHGDTLDALVLSSPVVGRWDTVTALLALDEIPDVPLDPDTLSRDPAVGAAYADDPLVWHGPFKRPTLQALTTALATVGAGPGLGDLPTLWIHGDDDRLVPIDGTREGIAHLRGAASDERVYPGGRHEMFNETNADEVVADVLAFLRRTVAADGG